MLEIPLTSDPEQSFTILIDGELYDMVVMLNSRTHTWSISIYLGEKILIQGLSLVCGVDLLAPYNFPIINLYMVNLADNTLDPGISDLGDTTRLFIVDEVIELVASVSDNFRSSTDDFVKLYGTI